MMNQSANLYQLQKIDLEIDRLNRHLQEIENILLNNDDLIAAEKKVADIRSVTSRALEALQLVEEEVKTLRIKKEQSETSLYGGKIRNPKELNDLETEISSLKKRIGNLEENQLEKMIDLENSENQEMNFKKDLNRVRAEIINKNSNLLGEKEQIVQKLTRYKIERSAAVQSISASTLEIYEKLRLQKRGIAVAIIQDSACSACGVSLRPAEIQACRAASDMFFCASCGRILYAG